MFVDLLKNCFRRAPVATALRGSGVQRLHLGCGTDIRDGWINLDSQKLPGVDVIADLDDCRRRPLPFPADSIDEFLCSHVLEHLRDALGFMQEMHRIAKPDALITIHVPYGSSEDTYAITATLTRRITKNIRWSLKYGYSHSENVTYGGHQNYQAQLLYSSLQYRF